MARFIFNVVYYAFQSRYNHASILLHLLLKMTIIKVWRTRLLLNHAFLLDVDYVTSSTRDSLEYRLLRGEIPVKSNNVPTAMCIS